MIYYKGARNKRIIFHVKRHHSLVHKDIESLQNYLRLAVTWQNTLPSYSLFTLPTYASANSCLLQTQVTSTTGYYREEKVTWNVRHLYSVFIESYSIFILHGIHHTVWKEKTSVNVSTTSKVKHFYALALWLTNRLTNELLRVFNVCKPRSEYPPFNFLSWGYLQNVFFTGKWLRGIT